MKSKLNYLTGVSLKRKIKTKWFVIANILIAVVIIAGCNIDHVIKLFGGDFSKSTSIYVIDNTNSSYDIFKSEFNAMSKTLIDDTVEDNKQTESKPKYKIIKYDKDLTAAKKLIKKDKKNIILEISNNPKTVISAKLVTEEYIDTTTFGLINNSINSTKVAKAIEKSNISMIELSKAYEKIEIDRVYLNESKSKQDEANDMMMGFVFPIVILPFFMLTLFLVQMIGAEVNDEKTTRGMEIIISNVSAKTHFFSKVLAGNLFVLIQGFLLFIYGGVGILIRSLIGKNYMIGEVTKQASDIISTLMTSGMVEKLIYIIPLTLLIMVLTFISYSLLAGILASITTNSEDFQQLQTPIIIVSIVGYYLATLATLFGGSLFIRVCAYIPLISAILAPSLFMLGQIGIIDMIVSIVLVIIANYLLIKYGLKIYKVGILNYSSKGLWKKMFKALKD